jgi:phosphoribosylformylglycinamidine synthase
VRLLLQIEWNPQGANDLIRKGNATTATPSSVLTVGCGGAQVHFPSDAVKKSVLANGQAPLRYVNDAGEPTTCYPANPNGSPEGIAALSSANGRHLALMPHPERAFRGWQVPYAPSAAGIDPKGAGPWMRLFQNAHTWCVENQA